MVSSAAAPSRCGRGGALRAKLEPLVRLCCGGRNPTTPAASCPTAPPFAAATAPAVVATGAGARQLAWFDAQLRDHHYLGAGRPVALPIWSPARYALQDCAAWIGRGAAMCVARLKLVVQTPLRPAVRQGLRAQPGLAGDDRRAAGSAGAVAGAVRLPAVVARELHRPGRVRRPRLQGEQLVPCWLRGGLQPAPDRLPRAQRPAQRLWLDTLAAEARARLCAAESPTGWPAGVLSPPPGPCLYPGC